MRQTPFSVHSKVFFTLLRKRPDLLVGMRNEDAARTRASYAIQGFVGENGSGKTRIMVEGAVRALARGRRVISSVPLLDSDPESATFGKPHPLYIPFDSWEVLREAQNCLILADEITGIANARENAALPGAIQLILNQLRKRRCTFWWSSPALEDATVQLRRVTRAITVCEGSWPDRVAYEAALAEADEYFEEGWVPNRLFRARTYRFKGVSEMTAEILKTGVVADEFTWGPGSPAFAAYDTMQENLRLGLGNEYGICTVCEGNRRRQECTCADWIASKEASKARRSAAAPLELHGHSHEDGEVSFAR